MIPEIVFGKAVGTDVPKVEFMEMVMDDPTYGAQSSNIPTVTVTITPSGTACTVELFLSVDGTTKAVTTGAFGFVSTGVAQAIQLPAINMPNPATGTIYGVYLKVVSGGYTLASYTAPTSITIPVVSTPVISWS